MARKSVERALQKYLPDGRFQNVPSARSRVMRAIRSRGNRSTEVRLRYALVGAGLSGWRMHPADIPGTPDFVFDRERVVVFVDGCFWHGCPSCRSAPKTNRAFWRAKFARNTQRDQHTINTLRSSGFSVLRLWEHELKVDTRACVRRIRQRLAQRLGSKRQIAVSI